MTFRPAVLMSLAILLLCVEECPPALAGHGGGGSHGGGSHGGRSHGGASHNAGAHRGHFPGHRGFGFFAGAVLLWPYFPTGFGYCDYPDAFHYNCPGIVGSPLDTAVRFEQAPSDGQQLPAGGYWYYCAESMSYFPYVEQCPAGWIPVTPQPPSVH